MRFVLLALLSFSVFAADVDGTLTYKLPNGELATRDVTLTVPSMGQGDVVLSGNNFEWTTTEFSSYEKNGKTVFKAVFRTEFMNFKSTIVFKGAYLQGTNEIIYAGSFYKKNGHNFNVEKNLDGFEHQGVFRFQYIR